MENITIDKIYLATTNKQNVPYENGQMRVTVKTADGRSMSSFLRAGHPFISSKPGDTFQATVIQNGQWMNFQLSEPNFAGGPSAPSPRVNQQAYDPLRAQVSSLLERVARLEKLVLPQSTVPEYQGRAKNPGGSFTLQDNIDYGIPEYQDADRELSAIDIPF